MLNTALLAPERLKGEPAGCPQDGPARSSATKMWGAVREMTSRTAAQ